MSGYRGGPTPGGKWGCVAAAAIGAPLFSFLILVDSLGDCAPDADCGKGFLRYVALPTLIVILPVGFGVRAAINRFRGTDS